MIQETKGPVTGGNRDRAETKNILPDHDTTASKVRQTLLKPDEQRKKPDATEVPKRPTQADVLIDLGVILGELFHDPTGQAFCTIDGGVTLPLASIDFREMLGRSYYRAMGKGANRNAITDAITTLSAQAKFDAAEHPVHLRLAGNAASAWLEIDLGTSNRETAKITPVGITTGTPVARFRRSNGTGALPSVDENHDFSLLWEYIEADSQQQALIAGFLLACLKPTGPYPVLSLNGPAGSAKSTRSEIIKRLVDPSPSPLRNPPKTSRDLMVAALNSWLPVWDNLSFLSSEMSDDICRLATGGALSGRALYTDHDEVLVHIERPCILNGIGDIVTRPDLGSRAIVIECKPPSRRRTLASLWNSFERDAGKIFSGLLVGAQQALRDHDKYTANVRLADVATWIMAGETALGFAPGSFLSAFTQAQDNAMVSALETSPVGGAILRLMEDHPKWKGTATELLSVLESIAGERATRQKSWPGAAHILSNRLSHLQPALLNAGISYETGHDGTQRELVLCKMGNEASRALEASRQDDSSNAANATNAPIGNGTDEEVEYLCVECHNIDN